MRRLILAGLVALAAHLALGAGVARAQTVTIKLGTVAPDGSSWHLLLKDMGQKWAEESGGKVKLKIFPGGIQGNEGDVIKKMRLGTLQAGAVSIVGIRDIDPGPEALGTPCLIDTDEEFQYVLEKLGPIWEKRLADQGFVVLSWGDTGFAKLFSKRKARTPADCQGLKIFTWANDSGADECWKTIGFKPVVLSMTDIRTSLETDMIEAFTDPPIFAEAARLYEPTKYMPDLNWGRLAGATIVSKEAWERIPADLRPKLVETAREVGVKINAEVAKMGHEAIEVMKKNGLEVLELSADEKDQWRQAGEKTWPIIRSKVVPADDFDLVLKTRDEYRAAHPKK